MDEKAYAPFLRLLAEQGVDVFLLHAPFHLSIFNISQADEVLSVYDYERWYVGGHSMGGAAAAIYAAKHREPAGIVLCAAYPTKQLEENDLVISIYGSEDNVLHVEKVVEGRAFVSGRMEEYVIPGGNHAQFGCYGVQSGDGEASITGKEQQKQAAEFILRCICENGQSE